MQMQAGGRSDDNIQDTIERFKSLIINNKEEIINKTYEIQ